MVIKPKVRGFICTTAHPVGCAAHVQEQIDYIQSQPRVDGPKKALIIGSSTGYGLATRIAAAFACGADTIGVCFEKPASDNRTATAGWYNTAAFEQAARQAGRFAKTVNGDAFSDEVKQEVIDLIRTHFGQVDLVVYSLASPRRRHPRTGETFSSVLKTIGQPFTSKTVDVHTGKVTEVTVQPATEEEIRDTIAVMGGEDWQMWMDALEEAGVLADGATTVAYSYIGPELTRAIYRDGTIGKAKDDLEATALRLNERLRARGGRAFVSVNKAVVTQSSSAIPVVPLYISLLFKVMKEKGLHEDCIQQMYRLLAHRLYTGGEVPVDDQGRIRLDELELREDVQAAVMSGWEQVTTDNLAQLTDIAGYRRDFLRLFGFEMDGVDYEADVNPDVAIG
ncbi:enoyl-ACP reductase FabV [Alicyclobacillus macrosporangiidus]|uniref:Trans-2-enoyl-CoA reductase [NADH] n=1 Tax=Alicyclobacillus macrosporangiidus TaxID=392015 RepID=A0A1I7GGG4_9BACL|nr:enoyl-ACP reductase FabV [Alicyclobacillus macrosporangiidus]SFU47582.1 enoyl-[acyl-carrier protein] reductase / trans-2-enoyl-CoA reductase (NAD+) [Alicyclobacillus macrosporangiidus]